MDEDSHLTEHATGQEQLLKGNFLHVVRDTVRLPDGGAATREYVLHPGAVGQAHGVADHVEEVALEQFLARGGVLGQVAVVGHGVVLSVAACRGSATRSPGRRR